MPTEEEPQTCAGRPQHDSPPPIPSAALEEITALYDRGLLLNAWERAKAFGPLADWEGPDAAVLAGRLAMNLGSPKLGSVIHWRNWRQHPRHLGSVAYYLHGLLERRGPLRALEFLDQLPAPDPGTNVEAQIYVLTLKSEVAWAFRDFGAAEKYLAEACVLNPNHPWLAFAEAELLSRQDRYEEALEAAKRSVSSNASYRPGVQMVAHLLSVLDRTEDAVSFLREADARMESGAVASQLALLEVELERFDDALRHFDRFLALSPLADKSVLQWLNANRIAVACRTNDLPRARELCAAMRDPYYRDLAGRIGQGVPEPRRARLPVRFVRQHHLTCAPATLSALSRFWNRPAEHLEVAEEICYDGTPNHSERRWAESSGYAVREFTVTWEAAIQLLDRGIPFTLTTIEITSSHLQAVIGYDDLRRSLLLRDPFLYTTSEALCPGFLERYAATGPRGLALVPREEERRYDGLNLPDAALYDVLHQLNCALDRHRRDEAAGLLARLESTAPAHRLTLTAGRVLGSYDGNTAAIRRHLDGLLEQFPKDANLNLVKWSCLLEQASWQERVAFLESVCALPQADPLFFIRLGSELRLDGREQTRALSLIRWALRYRPCDPDFLVAYADLLWDRRELEPATHLYRLASCLADKKEHFARVYFVAARSVRQTEAAWAMLQRRFEAFGRQSAQPAMTLFDMLVLLDRVTEAFAVLRQALSLRADDGELLLFAADAHARFGQFAEADRSLSLAEGNTRRSRWLRSAAIIAAYRAQRREALSLWREVLALEPLAMDANRAVAWLLAEAEGAPEACGFLEEVCARFPKHCGLLTLHAEFLRQEGGAALEAALRRLIEVNPTDAWAHRELALQLGQSNRTDEALAAAEAAIRIDPNNPC
ncbi:MAG: C39 family peptidase [Verrucomicrobia bacterium]|nr:C39 family peptidase [Verrucomicrobiota bacterium]